MAMSSTRLRAALICVFGLGATACVIPPAEPVSQAVLPSEQFPIAVTTAEREFGLVAHREGLSPRQREEVGRLLADWRRQGSGPVVIKIPLRASQDTLLAADRLDEFLRGNGLAAGQISRVGYDATGAAEAQLRIGFLAHAAQIPTCGLDHGSYTATGANRVNPNFGCAVSANVAAMAANPADLSGSRPEDPTDAGRRQVVLDKYRKGETTSSAKDEQADGAISDLAQ